MRKILTIIGARPQFIKASVVSKAIQAADGLQEVIGQHFSNELVGAIIRAAQRTLGRSVQDEQQLHGGGQAAERVVAWRKGSH